MLVPCLRFGRVLVGEHEDLNYTCLHSAWEKATYVAGYRAWEKASIGLFCDVNAAYLNLEVYNEHIFIGYW